MLATVHRDRASDQLKDCFGNIVVQIQKGHTKKSIGLAKVNLIECIDESNIVPTRNGERQSISLLKCFDTNAKIELTVHSELIEEE